MPYGLQPYFTFGEGDILSLGGRIFGALAYLKANLDPYLKVTGDRPDGFDFVDFQARKGAVVRSGAVLDIRFNITD